MAVSVLLNMIIEIKCDTCMDIDAILLFTFKTESANVLKIIW